MSPAVGVSLDQLLRGLPPLQRQAVTLVYVDGRSLRDAAEGLGVDRAAVGAALAAAFRRIGGWLRDDDDRAVDDAGATRTRFPASVPRRPTPPVGLDRRHQHDR